MSESVARAAPDWLALREPADAAARSRGLVEVLRPHLPTGRVAIHDLGCGTGSMARWLAPQLPGAQRWFGYERDAELLARAAASPPPPSLDGQRVTVATRLRDITRLPAEDLEGASLVTASALLDMLTRAEIERMVARIVAVGCPALITLSVIGQVELAPAHPLDGRLMEAFNAHQMRAVGQGRLLGPRAVEVGATEFARAGWSVQSAPSPWRLGAGDAELLTAWLEGWVGAACEQEPSLLCEGSDYLAWRTRQVESGQLTATIHHRDLVAHPAAV